jgi:hypothetical protein
LREAWEKGTLTRDETLQLVKKINLSMGDRRMKKGAYGPRAATGTTGAKLGDRAALMDEAAYEAGTDADKDRMLHEAVAEFLEANLMKNRKKSAEKSGMISGGVVNRNIKAATRLALSQMPRPLRNKFETILDTVRGVVGMASMRAVLMMKSIREGTLKESYKMSLRLFKK